MKPILVWLAVWLAWLGALPCSAADEAVPREHHPWARFKSGSWKSVRVLTETLDAQGIVTGVSKAETTSTLIEIKDSGFVLEVEAVVEVAGKRFPSQPRYVRQGFNGEAEGQRLISLKLLGTSSIIVNGRTIPSEMRQVVVNGGDQKRTTTLHYCSNVAPYVLKRETNTTDAAGQTTLSQNVVEVVALDMPLKILGEMKTVSHVKTIHSRPSGKTITLEIHCLDVPGTVVAHTSKEVDDTGRVLKRSTLELVDFDVDEDSIDKDDDAKNARRRGLFNRRSRKAEAGR